jgi:hypothetical protein
LSFSAAFDAVRSGGIAIAKSVARLLVRGDTKMFRRTFAIMLVGMLLVTAFGFQHVRAQGANDQQAAEKIRAKVQKIGVGGNAKVEVKLRDRTQLRGYINNADQDSFTVFDKMTGASKTVAYAETSSVKKAGGGLSAKTWIILGAAAVGAAVTWVLVKPALCDGGAGDRGPC